MILALEHHYLLPASVSAAAIFLLAAIGVGAWVGIRFLNPAGGPLWRRMGLFAARVAVGSAAMLAVFQAALRGLLLSTNWLLWPLAVLGAAAVETVLALYALERRTVSRRMGLALAAMRVALVLLVVAMLTQPVHSLDLWQVLRRQVVVLVDDSPSMRVHETQLTPAEKVRLAEMLLEEPLGRPHHLDASAQRLSAARQALAAQGEWLGMLSQRGPQTRYNAFGDPGKGAARQTQLEGRAEALHADLAEAEKTVGREIDALAEALQGKVALDEKTKAALMDAKAKLAVQVRDGLREGLKIVDQKASKNLAMEYDKLLDLIRGIATDLAELAPRIDSLGATLDEAFYASLPPPRKAQVDSVGQRTRFQTAQAVLLHKPVEGQDKGKAKEAPQSLLDRLEHDYALKVYRFSAQPAEVNLADWKKDAGQAASEAPPSSPKSPAVQPPAAPTSSAPKGLATATSSSGPSGSQPTAVPRSWPASEPSGAPADEDQVTDLAAALQKVVTEMPAEQLAGVLVLSDGRHNARHPVEPLARQLGMQHVPVSSVVFGGQKPPTDAAIVSLEAPETIYAKDKMYITAEVKLDGLSGRSAQVSLLEGQREVDFKTVRVPSDAFRAHVQLGDTPNEPGTHAYRVVVESFDEEVLAGNNEYPITVSVTDDRAKVLLIEGRPRWEFRYLKNLFSDRDKTVKLQYVLLEPDRIAGRPPPQPVAASASRPVEEVEATALPASEAEWMKFDVIILGDVDAAMIRKEQLDAVRKFVVDRAGTLIVIAGPRFMPQAYAGTVLEELLPATFRPAPSPEGDPKRDDSRLGASSRFRIELTAEGRDSVIMRQEVDPAENLKVWSSIPEIYWRYPILEAKAAATVLAYAMPPEAPPFRPGPPDAAEGVGGPQQRQFERQRALILTQQVAMGQVMCLTFDQTWCLRYRVGDTYHHKFWGQVLRWATAGKLPAGTPFVKLGADKPRYAPGGHVTVRAKIVRKDFSPVVSGDVAVNVFSTNNSGQQQGTPSAIQGVGGARLLRKKLDYQADSPGIYSADLGELPGGSYRIELDAPEAGPILALDGVDKVATAFSVDPSAPAELIELSPDRGLLSRLASLTGGEVFDPPAAARAIDTLRPATLTRHEQRQYVFWDSWPLLALIMILVTVEWLLRKKAGLA